MRLVEKAFAYITSGDRLLVFDHADFPDAGLQVPAGTIQPGESPAVAVLREAQEETGLTAFASVYFLGMTQFDARPFGKDELHSRHFFHLSVAGQVPERWRTYEGDASDGSDTAITFDLYWLSLPEAAAHLVADHGILIPVLSRRIVAANR